MSGPDLPIPESYWVIPGRLLAGEYPGGFDANTTRRRMDAFLVAGFDTFMDLTQPNDMPPYDVLLTEEGRLYGITPAYQRFPVLDASVPPPETMSAILDAIEEAMSAGHKVYVHCVGGVGRTGTVVGCYLVRHGYTGTQALEQLTAWWNGVPKHIYYPLSPETHEQEQYILDWRE